MDKMDVNYNLQWLFTNILTEEDAVKFLQYFNIIEKEKRCKKKHQMIIKKPNESVSWMCYKRACRDKVSVRKNTWLDGSTIAFKKIIVFIYSWAKEYSSIKYCKDELRICRATTIDFNNYLREVR